MSLLNASKAGIQLGVSSQTIKRWFEKGLFPNAYKIESTIRIPQSDIDELKKPKRAVV